MRWDLTGVTTADPGQLLGTALATGARTYEYSSIMGGQFIFKVDYQVGNGTTITAISLMPEFDDPASTFFVGAVGYSDRPATSLGSFCAPCSYRPGADSGIGATSGTPITPLVLRADRIDLPMTQVDAGQGNSSGGQAILSWIFFYPTYLPWFRWRVIATGGPGTASSAPNKADILQIYIGRGTLKGGAVFPGSGAHP